TAVIDPTTGLLATEYCPTVITEVFRQGQVPTQLCNRHQSWVDTQFAEATGQPEYGAEPAVQVGAEEAVTAEAAEKRHPFRRWLRKVFGGRNGDSKQEEERS